MKNAALYVRVSTDTQADEGYSIDEQLDRLKAYCKAQDWTVGGIYRDPGYSGSNLDRPGMRKLMAEATGYDVVVVYRLDRLSRSQKDTLHLIEDVFPSFVSITESFDTSTSVGKMMVGILSAFSQLERERIKERMQMGRIGRAKSGKPMVWQNPSFGYDYTNGEYEVNPLEAATVQEIYRLYLSGESQKGIVRILNARHALGKDWYGAIVKRILTNPIYTGKVRYLGKMYQGAHEAILDEDDWNRTQMELKRRQEDAYKADGHRPFQSRYMLSGLLRCARCGCSYVVTLYKPRKDGSRKRIYRCASTMSESSVGELRRAEHCDSGNYDMEDLERRVLAEVFALHADPKKYLGQRKASPDGPDTARITKRLGAIGKAEQRLVNLYVDGGLPIDMLNKKRDALLSERRELEDALSARDNDVPTMSADELTDVLDAIPGTVYELSYVEQKNLLNSLVDRIDLDGESMTLNWRFL